MNERIRRLAMGSIVPVLLIAAWEALARAGAFPPNLLPAPTSVFKTGVALAQTGELLQHIRSTVGRVLIGFLIGVSAGTLFGFLTGYSRRAFALLDPFIQALRNIPSMAWVPLFLLWLGIGEASKITLIAVGVFFPVYLNLLSGLLNVDRKLFEVGRIFRLSAPRLILRVMLPAAFPSYITGLRSGLAMGWMFVVAAELMGASSGIGFLMNDGQMTGRPGVIIVSILLFAICGKITDVILERVGARFKPGRQDRSLA